MIQTVMFAILSMILVSVATAQAADAGKSPAPAKNAAPAKAPRVIMKTSLGELTIELYPDKAPISVKNFLDYVDAKFYDGTIFHRVIQTFMIQGGGFGADMQQKPTRAPIKNEAGNGLKNTVGTLAMARTGVVDSATAQFFVNIVDNAFLDHRDETPAGFGYAVFGKVANGMDVVKKIAAVPTTTKGPNQNVPVTAVVIESVRLAP
ncbi:MAG: peptidyl-prolyl cis-trans isomerase [Deltaproteobacteria bacterium]|nr:peptidyl-prolyl cis-trans isomerase [Deltaproteobacteria bacterium]